LGLVYLGAQAGMEYYTGFLIEKSLSMDNVFVIALIFMYSRFRARFNTGFCSEAFLA
jgi:predicted tellurium resistance membrane protein TerC